MTKNHSGRYLQNLGICFKQGNPAFEKGNPASTEGNPTSRREILLSEEGPFSDKTKTTGGPGRARIGPVGICPTSAFSRRSGGHFPAEVGRRICPREASRRSGMHRKPALEAENPRAWAGVGQIQARQEFSRPPFFSEVGKISAQHKST